MSSLPIEMMYFADWININEQTNIIFKLLKCECEQQSIANYDITKRCLLCLSPVPTTELGKSLEFPEW